MIKMEIGKIPAIASPAQYIIVAVSPVVMDKLIADEYLLLKEKDFTVLSR